MMINFVVSMMVPRALGPEAFGNFEFISSFFTRIINFLNMGSTSAFYTKLSQRPKEFSLVSFYFTLSIFFILLLFFGISATYFLNIYTFLWPGQNLKYIFFGGIWATLTFFFQVLGKMADAYGLTVKAEIVRVIQRILGLTVIVALFFLNKLTLLTFFIYHYVLLVFIITSLIWLFIKNGYSFISHWSLSLNKIKKYGKEFYNYCHPLFTYSLVVLVVSILDRWLLQHFSGSIEQGYFGLGFKVGSICFLFTSSMTPLIHREYAIAYEKNDIKEMSILFRRYIPLLYAISAYLSCFVLVQSSAITYIIGGAEFNSAAVVVSILALYPIHQTYGQLSGAVFMATGQTKLRRNIGSFFQIIGLPISLFLITPLNNYGINAGAVGLALKIVIIQFLAVNVQLFYNARLLNLKFSYYLLHQILCVIAFISLAYSASYISNKIMFQTNIIINFIFSGFIYTFFVILLTWKLPILFGLNSIDVNRFLKLIKTRMNND